MRLRTIGLQLLLVSGNCLPLIAAAPSSEIPFKLYGGFAIIVRGAIANQENLNFLVDTGAVPSVVHQRLAQRLNLRGAAEEISVVNKSRSVERVSLPGLRLGEIEFPSASAHVVDLAEIELRLGVRLDAIVGLDVLGGRDFTIDYHLRRIRIGVAEASGEPIPFEIQTEAGAPYLVLRMDLNSQPLHLLLDTGTDSLTLFADRIRNRVPRLLAFGASKDMGAGGQYSVQRVLVSLARVGTIEHRDLRAALVTSSASASGDFDGLFGPASMGIARIAFDFSHHTLYVGVR